MKYLINLFSYIGIKCRLVLIAVCLFSFISVKADVTNEYDSLINRAWDLSLCFPNEALQIIDGTEQIELSENDIKSIRCIL